MHTFQTEAAATEVMNTLYHANKVGAWSLSRKKGDYLVRFLNVVTLEWNNLTPMAFHHLTK